MNDNCDIKLLKSKRKREKAEDFIGWKNSKGNLEVVDIIEKGKHTKYKIICNICVNDTELYPKGFFVDLKSNLIKGQIPCGCSEHRRFNSDQWLIIAKRVAKDFTVIGYSEKYVGQRTRIDCKCLLDGHRWSVMLGNLVNRKSGCPKCKTRKLIERTMLPEKEAIAKCTDICNVEGYIPVGFVGSYSGSGNSKFEYICPVHGSHVVKLSELINQGSRCPSCADYGYRPNKHGSFYVVKWGKGSESFIKIGITNRDPLERVKQQARRTDYDYTLIFTKTWSDGNIPLVLENGIKTSGLFNMGIINKCDFGDGFTETINIKDLDMLMKYISISI